MKKRRSQAKRGAKGRWWNRVPRKVVMTLLGMGMVGVALLDAWVCPRIPRFLERWPSEDSGFTPWEVWVPGVEYARANLTKPRPMKCHAIRIDLSRPEIRLKAGGEPDGAGGMVARWTSSHLRNEGFVVAINATPFHPEPYVPGRRVRPSGLVVKDAEALSAPAPNLDALILEPDGSVRFQKSQRSVPGAFEVLGGFVVILANGVNRGETGIVDAVTSVGVSADRHWMYWLVIDGRQKGYSDGAKGVEAAEILKGLGASDAMLFDGGGSTTLAARGGWSGARVLNRPRSPVISGLQRPVAAVLGVQVR